jgi:hypothetical protein
MLALIEAIAAPCPPLPPGLNMDQLDTGRLATETLHESDRLARLAAELSRGTRLVLVSDFAWLTDAHRTLLGRLAERLNVLAIRISDPAERALPDVGLARFQDLTDGGTRWLDTASKTEREDFAISSESHRKQVESLLQRSGISLVDAGSELDDLLPVLMRAN